MHGSMSMCVRDRVRRVRQPSPINVSQRNNTRDMLTHSITEAALAGAGAGAPPPPRSHGMINDITRCDHAPTATPATSTGGLVAGPPPLLTMSMRRGAGRRCGGGVASGPSDPSGAGAGAGAGARGGAGASAGAGAGASDGDATTPPEADTAAAASPPLLGMRSASDPASCASFASAWPASLLAFSTSPSAVLSFAICRKRLRRACTFAISRAFALCSRVLAILRSCSSGSRLTGRRPPPMAPPPLLDPSHSDHAKGPEDADDQAAALSRKARLPYLQRTHA